MFQNFEAGSNHPVQSIVLPGGALHMMNNFSQYKGALILCKSLNILHNT